MTDKGKLDLNGVTRVLAARFLAFEDAESCRVHLPGNPASWAEALSRETHENSGGLVIQVDAGDVNLDEPTVRITFMDLLQLDEAHRSGISAPEDTFGFTVSYEGLRNMLDLLIPLMERYTTN